MFHALNPAAPVPPPGSCQIKRLQEVIEMIEIAMANGDLEEEDSDGLSMDDIESYADAGPTSKILMFHESVKILCQTKPAAQTFRSPETAELDEILFQKQKNPSKMNLEPKINQLPIGRCLSVKPFKETIPTIPKWL